MLSQSGMWTVSPDLVMVISHQGLFALISKVQGPSATVGQEVWSSTLSHLGLAIPICLVEGVLFFASSSWGLIPCHIGGLLPLFSPLHSALQDPIPLSCHSKVHFFQPVMPAWIHPPTTLLPILFAHVGTALLIWLWFTCVKYYVWLASQSLLPGLCRNALCGHSCWVPLWLHASMVPYPPTGPLLLTLQKRQKGFFLNTIVIITFILMGLQGLVLWTIITYVYWHSVHLWQRTCMVYWAALCLGFWRPAPSHVDCICNKAILLSWLASVHFYHACYKFNGRPSLWLW